MRFDLVFPLVEWKIRTTVGGHLLYAKIDTGASLTLVGIDNAKILGINMTFTSKQPCVRYFGVGSKSDGYAFKVACDSLPIGSTTLPCSFVYVPFEYVVGAKDKKLRYRFITKYKYLIGTDILNEYDMSVQFTKATIGNSVKSVQLELTKHGFSLSKSTRKDYSFYQLAPKADEVAENLSDLDAFIECVD
jgi:hypothetical protein